MVDSTGFEPVTPAVWRRQRIWIPHFVQWLTGPQTCCS